MSSRTDRDKIEALAEKFVKKEKYEEAILEYQKLISGDEQDIAIRNIIGDLYIKARQIDRAVEEFKRISDYFEKRGIYTKSIAIYKRIARIAPEDIASLKKLADLYYDRGFVSEARAEYLRLAKKLTERKKFKEAIKTYEKLLKLDNSDVESRLSLAELYTKEGQEEKAVEELNEVAELKIQRNALKEAGEILKKARALNKDHSRTLENLIDLLKRENKRKDALKFVSEILKKDKENLKALYLLGNLCFEDEEFKKAGEIFAKIVASQPDEVDARVKLGRIHIMNKKYDRAFECYEPLVDTLVKKHREDKAIGFLGLILTVNKDHLPSLEKLASIYREKKQKKNLEIVARRLLKEYQKRNLGEEAQLILEELSGLFPEKDEDRIQIEEEKAEAEIPREAVSSEEEPDLPEETLPREEITPIPPEPASMDAVDSEEALVSEEAPEEFIEKELGKADVYIEQGMIGNAMEALENLREEFPDEMRIHKRLKELAVISSQMRGEDLGERVETKAEEEARQVSNGEKLTAAEIFADTDIVPLVSKEMDERRYFNLSSQVDQELEAIKHIIYLQKRGDTAVVEKDLSAIVTEFKQKVDERISTADLETRYNLGIAYMEQHLIEEAIKEFMLASQDQKWEMECYTSLGECYKRKSDLREAIKWYEKAMSLVGEDSIQAFALKYEIASLYEALMELEKALKLFSEVKDWNPEYGDVTSRVENLEKQAAK